MHTVSRKKKTERQSEVVKDKLTYSEALSTVWKLRGLEDEYYYWIGKGR